eukprot:5136388-Heterocapsa_arctica.AAC.1
MRAATDLVGDDRDAGKAWAMSDAQMFIGMMHGLLQDHATWKHWPDITLEDVTQIPVGQGQPWPPFVAAEIFEQCLLTSQHVPIGQVE